MAAAQIDRRRHDWRLSGFGSVHASVYIMSPRRTPAGVDMGNEPMNDPTIRRCGWANPANPRYLAYHDEEWGVPVTDDRLLFEMLTLEGAQAGLSWETVLNKRDGYRRLFAGFDPAKVAQFEDTHVERLLVDPGIVRNRLKVRSTIGNARAFLEIQARHGSFARWLWDFVDGRPIRNRWTKVSQVPASTPLSDRLSRELARASMRFVGTTIVYSYAQAVGLVNDHLLDCHRHEACARMMPRWPTINASA